MKILIAQELKIWYKFLIILFAILLIKNYVAGQTKFTDDLKVMMNFHSGYNIPEYPFITTITKDYNRSVDVCLLKGTNGKNLWEQIYNYPEYGISFFYSTLGNDKILGREVALTYFFRIFILAKKRIKLYNRIGIGIGYVSRKFDIYDNYLNVAVGSHYNIHFNCRLGINYRLSEKLRINAGLSFDHFSNANTGEPNLGINFITGYSGFSYNLGKENVRQKIVIKPQEKKGRFILYTSIGGKHSRSLSSKYFFTSSASFEFNKPYFRKFHFGIGGDLFFDSSTKSDLIGAGHEYKDAYCLQSGIYLVQSVVYNKFTLSVQEGIYLFNKQLNDEVMYNRGILQYQLNEHLLIRLTMKSHLHVLDYPEIGFGYKF